MKYLIGSKLLGLSNNKDNDYLIISNDIEYKRMYENGEDILYRSEDHIRNHLAFNCKIKKWEDWNYIVNYQLDQQIIGQNFPIEYHILDYRNELLIFLNKIVEKKMLNFNKCITTKNKCCTPIIYHFAYNLFILENNSPIITADQKIIIQKIHDGLMPIDYLDVLYLKLKNLNNKDNT